VKRRLFAILILLAALPVRALGPKDGGPRNVAVLLFPGVQIIDYTGPWEVLGHAHVDGKRAFRIYSVAETATPIETAMGMTVIPSFPLARAPRPDVLVIPGGNVSPQLDNPAVLRWIRENARTADVVLSVCNGAFFQDGDGSFFSPPPINRLGERPFPQALPVRRVAEDEIEGLQRTRLAELGRIAPPDLGDAGQAQHLDIAADGRARLGAFLDEDTEARAARQRLEA